MGNPLTHLNRKIPYPNLAQAETSELRLLTPAQTETSELQTSRQPTTGFACAKRRPRRRKGRGQGFSRHSCCSCSVFSGILCLVAELLSKRSPSRKPGPWLLFWHFRLVVHPAHWFFGLGASSSKNIAVLGKYRCAWLPMPYLHMANFFGQKILAFLA